jgi:pimeloyl-ACP methyl ester carboxylesterase
MALLLRAGENEPHTRDNRLMPAITFAPALSFFSAFGRMSPSQPLRTLIRTTGYKLRPPRPLPFEPQVTRAQQAVLARGVAGRERAAEILHEARNGPTPTIVLGGFVPDATEQVFLMRGFLLKHGSVFYLNYPRGGFSAELLFAQLDDLVAELTERHGKPPVIFAVSFGAGLVLEWLKRARRAGRRVDIGGLVLVSPVACVEDLLTAGEAKPSTLLGRAVKPYVEHEVRIQPGHIEKSRAIFTKMFEAGAQNRESLRALMTRGELQQLRDSVIGTIQAIDHRGACERMTALREMEPPCSYFSQVLLPLCQAPALILYAEKEGSVLTENSPTRFALMAAHHAYFPQSQCKVIVNRRGSPVQHASLIFHCFNFLPPISAFYRRVKAKKTWKSAA